MHNTMSQSREFMEKSQLLTGNIRNERVLEAIDAIDRSEFVPQSLKEAAYVDEEIPLCSGRFLMEPLAFARMLEIAEIQPEDKILDIGCGLGYSASVLAQLAGHVIGIENEPDLVNLARQKLSIHANVEVITSPLVNGSAAHKPFDLIIIEGAVQHLPETLLEQLSSSGRLVTVENKMMRPGSRSGLGRIMRVDRHQERFESRYGADVSVPVMPGFEKKKTFEF